MFHAVLLYFIPDDIYPRFYVIAAGRGRPARGRKPAETESEEESEAESDQSVVSTYILHVIDTCEFANIYDATIFPQEIPKRKAPPAKNNTNNKTPKPRAKRAAAASSKPIKDTSSGDEDDKKDDNESEDDEPLSKKAKPSPPSVSHCKNPLYFQRIKIALYLSAKQDDEIKKYVKEILDKANLEEITMKTVCKQVYEKYPDFDLSHKKEFIKTTVKSVSIPRSFIFLSCVPCCLQGRCKHQCVIRDYYSFSVDIKLIRNVLRRKRRNHTILLFIEMIEYKMKGIMEIETNK